MEEKTVPQGVLEDYGGPETFGERVGMYDWVIDTMVSLGLATGDVIVDLGAGFCDLDMRLRQRGWFGRYVPVDGALDGTDLEKPGGTRMEADFYVSLDTFEHLHNWPDLLTEMKARARKGLVVTTPDGDTVDVLAMHPTHVCSLTPSDLWDHGLVVSYTSFPEYRQMLGFWSTKWAVTANMDHLESRT